MRHYIAIACHLTGESTIQFFNNEAKAMSVLNAIRAEAEQEDLFEDQGPKGFRLNGDGETCIDIDDIIGYSLLPDCDYAFRVGPVPDEATQYFCRFSETLEDFKVYFLDEGREDLRELAIQHHNAILEDVFPGEHRTIEDVVIEAAVESNGLPAEILGDDEEVLVSFDMREDGSRTAYFGGRGPGITTIIGMIPA